ncbi:MAG: DUF479 domain-containing protein [Xanthomonadales bacterium]|nr:DUF479 domain-containing protein [Xanthomonadales bacterium]
MNHLAHALLSGAERDMILGGMMGDFVHGRIDPALPLDVRRGLALHRAIDSYTDSHALVAALRARFDPPFRRYAGILVDIGFDHLLARDFARWSDVPLPAFSTHVVDVLSNPPIALPERMQAFVGYMRVHDLPAAYADRAMIARVLAGVGSRLRRANPLAEAMPELDRLAAELAEAFAEFFPQLVAFAQTAPDIP